MSTTLTLYGLARALGGRIVGGSVRCPGPGHSKHDDSLVVSLANSDDGFTVYSHAGDDFRDCKDYVRERMGLDAFGGGRREVDPDELDRRAKVHQAALEAAEARAAEKRASAIGLWGASSRFVGSIAEQYLLRRLAGRGVPEGVYEGEALRYIPLGLLPQFFRETGAGAVGAMVALMTDPENCEPTGVHLTFITADGSNLKERRGDKRLSVRRMWGNQGVVRLWSDAYVNSGLAIGEGIENVLSGAILTHRAPAWAALDAGGVEAFPVLPGIDHLTLFVDNDASGTGQRAALRCGVAWRRAGAKASTIIPEDVGHDMNDVLLAEKAVAIG